MTAIQTKSVNPRKPLTVWEPPSLLRPVHEYRRSAATSAKSRPHFERILAFVYRNRYATALQIQRRFAEALPSDRTARRHLAELQSLGWLEVVCTLNTSPLWPKVYFVTKKGLIALRKAYSKAEKHWQPELSDRRRNAGESAVHVLHELSITEFLLLVWEAVQARDDLELLNIERRSILKHPALSLTMRRRETRVQPDAMFMFRQRNRGMMFCFVEIDCGTCHERQILDKLERYSRWGESRQGREYLEAKYRQFGAAHSQHAYRILMMACGQTPGVNEERCEQLSRWVTQEPSGLAKSIWLASADRLQAMPTLNGLLWTRVGGKPARIFSPS